MALIWKSFTISEKVTKFLRKKKISMHNDIHVSGIFERSFIILQQAHEWRSPRKQFMWNSDKIGTTERTRGIVIVFIRISRDQSRQLQKQKLWRLILPLDGVDVHTIDHVNTRYVSVRHLIPCSANIYIDLYWHANVPLKTVGFETLFDLIRLKHLPDVLTTCRKDH